MSAVIWCGIVAVWVFVLIPTWVRRGDLHWHRGASPYGSMKASIAAARAGRATDDPAAPEADHERGRWSRMTGLRPFGRSSGATPEEVDPVVDEMDQHDDIRTAEPEPAYETEERAPAAVRARVAAAPTSQRLSSAVTSMGSGLRGLRASAANHAGRDKAPLRVRRARRLLALAAVVVITLVVAIMIGGPAIAVNVIADLALILYLRHLRNVARAQRAHAQRERRARAARQAWDAASASERASHLEGWRTPEPAPLEEESAPAYEEQLVAQTAVTEQIDLTLYDEVEYDGAGYEEAEYDDRYGVTAAQPAAVQDSLYDQHAPTEELQAVKAS